MMIKRLFAEISARCWLMLAFVLVPGVGFAADPASSDGKLSEQLATQLYCDTKGLLEGNIGLLIGLIMVFLGIWAMVQGGKVMAALPMILGGAVITALPSIVEASLIGLGNLLGASDVKITYAQFVPPNCGETTQPSAEDIEKAMKNSQTGAYYPSRGTYDSQKSCPPGAGSSVCE